MRRASLGRPDEYLSVDVGRDPLDPDQLATQFFETVMIETKAQLNPAIGDAALSDEASEDLFQHPRKVHVSALVRRDLRGRRPELISWRDAPLRHFLGQAEKPAISPALSEHRMELQSWAKANGCPCPNGSSLTAPSFATIEAKDAFPPN